MDHRILNFYSVGFFPVSVFFSRFSCLRAGMSGVRWWGPWQCRWWWSHFNHLLCHLQYTVFSLHFWGVNTSFGVCVCLSFSTFLPPKLLQSPGGNASFCSGGISVCCYVGVFCCFMKASPRPTLPVSCCHPSFAGRESSGTSQTWDF